MTDNTKLIKSFKDVVDYLYQCKCHTDDDFTTSMCTSKTKHENVITSLHTYFE